MTEYLEYLFVGGPMDGRKMTTDGTRIVRVPIMQHVAVALPKVVPFDRGRQLSQLTVQTTDYERFGPIYWWEGLIRDAWVNMDVSEEAWMSGGAEIRGLVRDEMRRALQGIAPDKELGRVIWRITRDPLRFMFQVRAFVGPTAMDRGLAARAERRP